MLVPFFILYPLWLIPVLSIVIVFAIVLRRYEKSEPEIIPRPTPRTTTSSPYQEDHDVSNQFTVVGSVKPSAFRRMLLVDHPVADQLRRAPRLQSRLPRAHPDHPLRALDLPQRQAARAVPQQLRRQPPRLHGRLHQQGRVGAEHRLQQRLRLSAHQLADLGRRQERAALQGHQPPPPDPDAGLVQGLSRPHGIRSRAQHAHPRRAAAALDARGAIRAWLRDL